MSLRLRLALWYGGLTGVVVVLVCVYSYAVHSRAHYDELDRVLLHSGQHVVEELLAAEPNEYQGVLTLAEHLGTRVALLDSAGRTVVHAGAVGPSIDINALRARPPRPAYPLIAHLAPSLHRVMLDGGRFAVVDDRAGHRWRVFVLPFDGGHRVFAMSQPLADLDTAVARFGAIMLVMAAVGSVLTFAVGWLLAGRALQPVAGLTAEARAIARSHAFSRRVPVAHPRDELGRLAVTFNEMLGSLETAYTAQQRFVGDASHELRAPLTVLQANLELLRRAPSLDPDERTRALEDAHTEAQRLARLVADLLALARADAGEQLRRDQVELDRVLMDVLGQARHLAKGQRLEVAELEPAVVVGDADRLKQLLLILLDNAIKYTPPGGRVALGLRREGNVARVTVRDTGIGIPAESLPHVFERFYRADPARSRDPGGTGLGLSIARWIVAQHGGNVDLTSAPGQGTTAVVMVPVS